MAQVYVSQRVNVLLKSGSVVAFVPGVNDVPPGTETDPFIANLIANTADQVEYESIIAQSVTSATQDLKTAQDALSLAVATSQKQVLDAVTAAGVTWAANRQTAINASQPYNVRHPDPNVANGIAISSRPSQVAGAGFTQPVVAPVNTDVPAVMRGGVVVTTGAVGDNLTVTNGNWTSSPTSYSYQWKRGATNVGTNSNAYTTVAGDSGATITCVVTATNAMGSTAAPPSNGVAIT